MVPALEVPVVSGDSSLMPLRRRLTGTFLGARDFATWLDAHARTIFGVSGQEFVRRYESGAYANDAAASDLASVIPLIRRDGGGHPQRGRDRDTREGP
jgi:hypothetical protein